MTDNSLSENGTGESMPTTADVLTIRYKTTLGWGFVALGLLNMGLGIWLLLLGQLISAGIIGILLLGIGYLYLKRPYFEVRQDRITLYNLLGNVVKRYPLTPHEQLTTDGKKLLIEQAGMTRKVAVNRFLIKNEDWASLESRIGSRA
ncbi:MAG: hypothetical protein AAFY78_12895 [Cyanobacteria bacterium J06648_16]